MLVRRLDAAGDAENAAATREVAERLRAICGDLRLPVLDDLGVGPALDWLCERMEQGGGRSLARPSGREKRLPADAELAFFRVAQEAITTRSATARRRSWFAIEAADLGGAELTTAARASDGRCRGGRTDRPHGADEHEPASRGNRRRPFDWTAARRRDAGSAGLGGGGRTREHGSGGDGDGDGDADSDSGRFDDRRSPTCHRPGGDPASGPA